MNQFRRIFKRHHEIPKNYLHFDLLCTLEISTFEEKTLLAERKCVKSEIPDMRIFDCCMESKNKKSQPEVGVVLSSVTALCPQWDTHIKKSQISVNPFRQKHNVNS